MLFDFSNYIFFIVALAIVYIALVNMIQGRVGGKNRLANLQKEMRDVQLKMIAAGKKGDEKASNEIMKDYWKLTGELFTLQMQMTLVIIVIFMGLMAVFPYLEPGAEDDTHLPLYDDGLASHCDSAAGDFIFSNCLSLPASGVRGAWVVDAYLKSGGNETIARNATALYYEGGIPEDVWLQQSSQVGLWDILQGKKPYYINVATGKGENHTYKSGDIVGIHATPRNIFTASSQSSFDKELADYNAANVNKLSITYQSLAAVSREAALPNGTNITDASGKHYTVTRNGESFAIAVQNMPLSSRIEAVSDSGTFFHYDAPFTLPLLNIRRIIGSYGVFIFIAFVVSIAYAVAKAVYAKAKKKQN